MQRLKFRAWRESDLKPFARVTADPRVMPYFATPLKSEGHCISRSTAAVTAR
jgi:RimJ/RimL family protein N-acetyltransferase